MASSKDGDFLCPTAQTISRARESHEEETVWKALSGSGLLVTIDVTAVDVGPGILGSHPCYRPQDLLCSIAARGKLDMVFGIPLSTCTLPGTHSCLCCLSFWVTSIPIRVARPHYIEINPNNDPPDPIHIIYMTLKLPCKGQHSRSHMITFMRSHIVYQVPYDNLYEVPYCIILINLKL